MEHDLTAAMHTNYFAVLPVVKVYISDKKPSYR